MADLTPRQHGLLPRLRRYVEGLGPYQSLVLLVQKKKPALRDVNSVASSTVLKLGFNGDGAVVSYLEKKGDNHETYDNSISLCVRALRRGRNSPHSSSRVARQDLSHL
jgi:hypothetical protein